MANRIVHKLKNVTVWFESRANAENYSSIPKISSLCKNLIVQLFVIQCLTGMLLSINYEPNSEPLKNARNEYLVPCIANADILDIKGDTIFRKSEGIFYLPYDTTIARVSHPVTGKKIDVNTSLDISIATSFSEGNQILMSNRAYNSVYLLTGSIVRSVHIISSHLLVVSCLFFLILGTYFKLYSAKNELLWLLIVALLFLIFIAVWSGSVLPWDVRGREALNIGSSTVSEYIPIVGDMMRTIFNGIPDYNRLLRVYTLHTLWLPCVTLLVLWATIKLVKQRNSMFRVSGAVTILFLLAISTLAGTFQLGYSSLHSIDSSVIVGPEWYFNAPYYLIKSLPTDLAVTLMVVWMLMLLSLPFIHIYIRKSILSNIISYSLLFSWMLFTVLGASR